MLMGVPMVHTKDILHRLLINTLSIMGLIRAFISTLSQTLGLARLLQPATYWPGPGPELGTASASLIREMLPATKFTDVGPRPDRPERCAICMRDFRDHDEIRRLRNCRHVFHRGCVDRWMDHDQRTCPLCRASLIPDHLVEAFSHKLSASPTFPEFSGDFSPINHFF